MGAKESRLGSPALAPQNDGAADELVDERDETVQQRVEKRRSPAPQAAAQPPAVAQPHVLEPGRSSPRSRSPGAAAPAAEQAAVVVESMHTLVARAAVV